MIKVNKIVINGTNINCNGQNLSIVNGKIKVDGNLVSTINNNDINVEVYGNCGDIDTTGNVNIQGNCNNVDCNGNVTCYGDIKGNIDCNGNVSLKRN